MVASLHQSPVALPKRWSVFVKSAVLQAISLARYTIVHTRSWAAESRSTRVRLAAKVERLEAELAQRNEQLRIVRARLTRIPPRHRPRYSPRERMDVLQLKAARGWSLRRTAQEFLVTPETVASWLKRLDEDEPEALAQLPQPVNKFPPLVRYVVQRLKVLCPAMGKVKIAQTLARAGLHLGATTVGRILKEEPRPRPPDADPQPRGKQRSVSAKCPNHVWHIDLTLVPTGGLWTSWLPFALPQCWPFGFWVAVVVDHFSRRAMGCTAFRAQPTSEQVRVFLGRTMAKAKARPKSIVCDRGSQFDCHGFRRWCRRSGIRPRYGAIGRHGSIAVVERFILTLKTLLGCLLSVPYWQESLRRELGAIVEWYNVYRPHTRLGGKTPDEAYYGTYPANRKPRFEPRARWPRGSPCAAPWALVRGAPGANVTLEVRFHGGRKHLPEIRRGLRCACALTSDALGLLCRIVKEHRGVLRKRLRNVPRQGLLDR